MDPKHLFMDERLTGSCVYCGARPDTRDHVPSRVLLDEPFPPQLPVVGACRDCNESFSRDELYVACFIEAAVSGTAEPAGVNRVKIQRILADNPALASRIASCRHADRAGNLMWQPEIDRMRKIILKLARGHAAYELYPQLHEPEEVSFAATTAMEDDGLGNFENTCCYNLECPVPEIGTRAFMRAFGGWSGTPSDGWITIQPGRYRYMAVEDGGVLVQIVLSEFLACRVCWN